MWTRLITQPPLVHFWLPIVAAIFEHDRERDSDECDSEEDLLKNKQKHKRKKAKKGADPASSKSLFFSQMD